MTSTTLSDGTIVPMLDTRTFPRLDAVPTRPVRLHEAARAAGVASKHLLRTAQSLGQDVRASSTTVEPVFAQMLVEHALRARVR